MNSTRARERIFGNMDALSIEMDALNNLNEVKQNINICINRINKIIERGQGYNRQLESLTKHAA